MLEVTYKVMITPLEEGGYGVSVPALPGCFTWGHSYEEAVAMAKDSIQGYLASVLKHGGKIPVEEAEHLVMLGISVRVPAMA